ncbi:MAG: glycosyltransferase [Cyanobacteriota bacterium]|nr:glycosyltransferase [Cyanobacteriota bacterium]
MRFTTCITTRNAPERLDSCLSAIWRSDIKPYSALVSDDSSEEEVQNENRRIVEKYPDTTYILGPQRGVNANRNCAVNAVFDTDLVAFVDDDIWIDPDFIHIALVRYSKMSPQEQKRTFLTGVSYTRLGQNKDFPTKLGFRGYYRPTKGTPKCVNIHAAVFPRSFFNEEQWEEPIFFGQGDAILCLRALRRGYQIIFCTELRALNTRPEGGTLAVKENGELTDYDIHQIAARLYIGVKRYKELFPNPLQLAAFIAIYFPHMTFHLARNGALDAWPKIIQRSRFRELW